MGVQLEVLVETGGHTGIHNRVQSIIGDFSQSMMTNPIRAGLNMSQAIIRLTMSQINRIFAQVGMGTGTTPTPTTGGGGGEQPHHHQ